MRGVRAKILRALAQSETVSAPNVVWLDAGRKVNVKKGDKTLSIWRPRCELATGCTRAKYQNMKKAYKAARREGRHV